MSSASSRSASKILLGGTALRDAHEAVLPNAVEDALGSHRCQPKTESAI